MSNTLESFFCFHLYFNLTLSKTVFYNKNNTNQTSHLYKSDRCFALLAGWSAGTLLAHTKLNIQSSLESFFSFLNFSFSFFFTSRVWF